MPTTVADEVEAVAIQTEERQVAAEDKAKVEVEDVAIVGAIKPRRMDFTIVRTTTLQPVGTSTIIALVVSCPSHQSLNFHFLHLLHHHQVVFIPQCPSPYREVSY
jgi:hypothetical protein